MRNYIYFFLLLLFGCEDFLEEKSQTEIRPSTVKDMERLLEGEAYFAQIEGPIFNTITEIFTDDWQCNMLNPPKVELNRKIADKYHFTWDPLMFEENGGGEDLTIWTVPYSRIKGCNVILEYMEGMNGNEEQRLHILGEAYALRGFYYFYLVNFFGLPYNYGEPEKNQGVPLKLTSGVTDEKLKCSTVAECYKQIEQDLLEGIELMKKGRNKASVLKTRLNHIAAEALLTRVYLYMENWDKVIQFADSVLQENSSLTDITQSGAKGVYNRSSSTEILWGGVCEWYNNAMGIKYPYTPSEDLVSIYLQDIVNDEVDVRGDYNSNLSPVYLKKGGEWIYVNGAFDHVDYFVSFVEKSNSTLSPINGGIRVAEVYLNRAEAYIARSILNNSDEDAQKGLDDLNTLRAYRLKSYVHKEMSDFPSKNDLLAFCLRERRRELCGEGNHRWFDLRRNGMPEIKHLFFDEDSGQATEYILQKEDARYVLPIPSNVINRNPNLR